MCGGGGEGSHFPRKCHFWPGIAKSSLNAKIARKAARGNGLCWRRRVSLPTKVGTGYELMTCAEKHTYTACDIVWIVDGFESRNACGGGGRAYVCDVVLEKWSWPGHFVLRDMEENSMYLLVFCNRWSTYIQYSLWIRITYS